MDVAGLHGEFLVLEYADGDKLYVPWQALHLVSAHGRPAKPRRCTSSAANNGRSAPPARHSVFAMSPPSSWICIRAAPPQGTQMQPAKPTIARSSRLPFEETADQATAIEQVLGDLKSGKPMDG